MDEDPRWTRHFITDICLGTLLGLFNTSGLVWLYREFLSPSLTGAVPWSEWTLVSFVLVFLSIRSLRLIREDRALRKRRRAALPEHSQEARP